MRLKAASFIGLASIALLALPVWAHTDSTTFHSDGTVMIGGTQLKAGDYQLKIQPNAGDLQVTQDGKQITQVPVHWIQLPNKPQDTEVSIDKNRVVEVEFAGKTEALQIQYN